jgi:hypothetical protein
MSSLVASSFKFRDTRSKMNALLTTGMRVNKNNSKLTKLFLA